MRRGREGSFLLCAGTLLLCAAMALAGFYLWKDHLAGAAASERLLDVLEVIERGPSDGYDADGYAEDDAFSAGAYANSLPDYMVEKDLEMPVEYIDGIGYIGVLKMPTVDKELPIIAKYKFEDLEISPCRYFGSVYRDNMVICGHSYMSHFRPIRQLKNGDPIIFEDVDGNVFSYTVGITEILKPTDMAKATDGKWDLTLFTCTSDSASRFTVRCLKTDSADIIKDV